MCFNVEIWRVIKISYVENECCNIIFCLQFYFFKHVNTPVYYEIVILTLVNHELFQISPFRTKPQISEIANISYRTRHSLNKKVDIEKTKRMNIYVQIVHKLAISYFITNILIFVSFYTVLLFSLHIVTVLFKNNVNCSCFFIEN